MKKMNILKPASLLLSMAFIGASHYSLAQAASVEEVQSMVESAPTDSVHTVVNENGDQETENTGKYYNSEKDPINLTNEGHLPEDSTIPTEERVITGEFHNHTNQSSDASESYMSLENLLDAAFHEDLDQLPEEGRAFVEEGKPFDYFMTEDHLRKSPRDINGNEIPVQPTWKTIQEQIKKFNELKAQGKYEGKIYYPGFEWDMFGLDHVTVALIEDGTNRVPLEGIRQFEWLYSYDTPTEAFTDNELEVFGPRDNVKADKTHAYDGLKWIQENYPDSFYLVNHPSRHNGGGGVVHAEDIRDMIAYAPDIVAGLEGMPGNQMGGDRGEMHDIYGGADKMVAELGGVWDSLLGEGHDFFNYANSDFHFKISSNGLYSSGYWPSEYSRNYTKVEGNTFQDISEGMKKGNSWSVYGDLISGLEFFVKVGDKIVEMGDKLSVAKDTPVELVVRFQETKKNNYKHIFEGHESDVTNHPILDHIDLIVGNIFGKVQDKTLANNPTTRIGKRFTSDDWKKDGDEGWYSMSLPFQVDQDMYLRLRGTNNAVGQEGETDALGNPLIDPYMEKPEISSYDNPTEEDLAILREYFNQVNDRNYSDLWFYSNPIRLMVDDDQVTVSTVFENVVKSIVAEGTKVNEEIISEETPEIPGTPTPEAPGHDSDNEDDKDAQEKGSDDHKSDDKSNSELKVESASVLPQTGEQDSTVLFTGAALSILAGLGLVVGSSKKEEN